MSLPAPGALRFVLCDADGNLFPSEEPAFVASAEVTNALLADLGTDRRFEAEELRRAAVGRNFRAIATDLAADAGVVLDPADLDRRVADERRAVTAHLGRVLAPDPAVGEPLRRLGERFSLAAVSSSALARLDACFAATDLAVLLPAEVRFSAEDSLAVPTSKPDPAVYRFALERLGIAADEALAVEDAVAGVQSAVAAGIPTAGNLQFVAADERAQRADALLQAGASVVVGAWDELEALLA